MEMLVYLLLGIALGSLIGWFVAKSKTALSQAAEKELHSLKQSVESERNSWAAALQEKKEEIHAFKEEINSFKEQVNKLTEERFNLSTRIASTDADLRAAAEKMKEMEEIRDKFNKEFENIANRLLDTKSEKFTELNKKNIETILGPLGQNIMEFKSKVEEVYVKESKERFSLGEKVKELQELNQQLSSDAKNLTSALKGEAKTQGLWGEMILENILEKSGLAKDREYFMEHQLVDMDGQALRTDSEGKKMRPDAVIKYPDNRSVIIDAKVSLNAFSRYIAAEDAEAQKRALQEHVEAVKGHVLALSAKGYDDYDKSLDFVMMFVPSEPAYMAALQGDSNLWNYAYDRRILLLSPTNLITSLKLIADLWKREYQNRNAQEIAERGAKLYDKFVGFVGNLESIGDYIGKAQAKYSEAHKQLTTGNDNLLTQANKLRSLGLKTKKELPNAE